MPGKILKGAIVLSFFSLLMTSLTFFTGCGAQKTEVKKEEPVAQESSSAPAEDKYEVERKNFEKIVRNIPFKVKSYELYLNSKKYTVDNETIEKYLDEKFIPALKRLVAVLPPDKKIIIEGHASTTGTEEPSKNFIGNIELSKRRAEIVLNYLEKKLNVDKNKVIIKYYGSSRTLPGIDPKDDKNCRVSFSIM